MPDTGSSVLHPNRILLISCFFMVKSGKITFVLVRASGVRHLGFTFWLYFHALARFGQSSWRCVPCHAHFFLVSLLIYESHQNCTLFLHKFYSILNLAYYLSLKAGSSNVYKPQHCEIVVVSKCIYCICCLLICLSASDITILRDLLVLKLFLIQKILLLRCFYDLWCALLLPFSDVYYVAPYNTLFCEQHCLYTLHVYLLLLTNNRNNT